MAIREEVDTLERGNPDKGIHPTTKEVALQIVCERHPELAASVIRNAVENGADLEF